MPQQQKPNPYATPAQPTRERALYVTAARVYVDAFRAVFVDPTTARRRFRRAAEWSESDALAALLLHPDYYGPRCARQFASAVRDPAFVYWTQRERRPRAVLMRIVELLYGEAAKRAHVERIDQTRKLTGRLAHDAASAREARKRLLGIASQTVQHAGEVYADPRRACRAILRTIRRHEVERTRALLEVKPDFFGPLRVEKHPRGFWPFYLVFCTTDEAERCVDSFLVNGFDATVRAHGERVKAGEVLRTVDKAAFFGGILKQLVDTEPDGGALAEAARLVAILCRRRDVDEAPKGKGPPPIYKQLAAMLPERMHGLIVEALKLAKSETGESPVWDRGDGYGRELARSLGVDRDAIPSRGISRGSERGRGGGLSL
jgi:hypothetical protein